MRFFLRPLARILVLPLIILTIFAMLMSASVRTYSRLSDETVIAEVSFRQLDEQVYEATLLTEGDCREEKLTLYGDQWRIDASFLKWKYWANLLGLDAQYRLDRIEGRYDSIADENSKEHTAYDLVPRTTLDVGNWSTSMGKLNFLADAEYGVSTYTEMTPGQSWLVYRTQSGIITRPGRGIQRSESGALRIEITAGCVEEKSTMAVATNWLDKTLAGFIYQP
jgi:hypothetical protein